MIVSIQIAVIIFDAWYQAFHIEKNRFNIPHFAAASLVSMFAIMSNMLFALYYCQVSWKAVVYFSIACVLFIGLRAMVFDPIQNIFRGLKWNRETTATKGDIAKTDLILRKFKNDLLIKSLFLLLCLLTIKLIICATYL